MSNPNVKDMKFNMWAIVERKPDLPTVPGEVEVALRDGVYPFPEMHHTQGAATAAFNKERYSKTTHKIERWKVTLKFDQRIQ